MILNRLCLLKTKTEKRDFRSVATALLVTTILSPFEFHPALKSTCQMKIGGPQTVQEPTG